MMKHIQGEGAAQTRYNNGGMASCSLPSVTVLSIVFRVLVSAVKKDHINLKLHFFNNCFNDDLHKHCEKTNGG